MRIDMRCNLKQYWASIIIVCLLYSFAYSGDDPCNATQLDPSSVEFQTFDNSSLGDSGVPAPPYGGYNGNDIWFEFVMPAGGFVNLILKEGSMSNPAVALYEGPCEDPKLLYNILDHNCNDALSPAATLDELQSGETYYLRVWAEDGSGNGTFDIFLSETTEFQPSFILHSDAMYVGDCIMLTDDINTQHGCAWFEIPIDFSQAFIHEMTAYFGDKDGNGADGICLIYQANGPDYCGSVGEGIGAQGMPNSAIFEFDTWQNGNLNDPFNDHSSFNLNGNMNHNNSLAGPIDLGNIEDGFDHYIRFEYDGSGGYELYFDDILLFGGYYDFVNDIFGGSNSAWWGYTAATGGSNNEHVICPDTEEIELGTQEYREIEICEGEDYNGYNESGFYVDFEPGDGNCLHQINTLLTVHPLPDPVNISEYLCEGEYIELAGELFDEDGFYEILLESHLGCDSFIYLDLTIPELYVEVIVPGTLDCTQTSLELSLIIESNHEINDLEIEWDTPSGYSNSPYYIATEPGLYQVSVYVYMDSIDCPVENFEFVYIDSLAPSILLPPDIYLDCHDLDSVQFINSNVSPYNVSYAWYFDNNLISTQADAEISNAGTYYLVATNPENGCTATDSTLVHYNVGIPDVQIIGDTLDCTTSSFQITTLLGGEIDSLYWTLKDSLYSTETSPFIDKPGTYTITVIGSSGCISEESIHIISDTIPPEIIVSDAIIPCNEDSTQLEVIVNPDILISWVGPQHIAENIQKPFVEIEGTYYVSAVDPANNCGTTKAVNVIGFGDSPELSIQADTINCITPSSIIDLNCDQPDATFIWSYDNEIIDSTEDINVISSGYYYVEVSSSFGCISKDSILIIADLEYPAVTLYADSMDCGIENVTLSAEVEEIFDVNWLTPTGETLNQHIIESDLAGIYLVSVSNPENGCVVKDSIELIDKSVHINFELKGDTLTCSEPLIFLDLQINNAYEYISWIFPNGTQSGEISPEVEESGEYELHIEVEGNCDIDTSILIFEDFSIPSVDIDYTPLDCNSPTTTIELDIKSDVELVEITSPSGQSSNENKWEVDDPGVYLISVSGRNGCVFNDTIEIKAYFEKPEGNLITNGPITCLQPEVTIELESNDNLLQYQWSGETDFTYDHEIIAINTGGEYELIVMNEHGCISEFNFEIEEYTENPEIDISGNAITCLEPESYLELISDQADLFVNWKNQNDNTVSNVYSYLCNTGGWYFVDAQNIYGCISEDSIFIQEHTEEPEIILLSENPLSVNPDDPTPGQILIEIISDGNYEILWAPQDGLSCFHCPDPVVLGNEIEQYEVNVINEFGCSNEISVDIRYKRKTIVEIPNVFTPYRQDGINDYFNLFANENVSIIKDLLIYDRWGELMVHKQNIVPNITEMGWDGKFRGKFAIKGVYTYFFRISTVDGEILTFYGDVTLL